MQEYAPGNILQDALEGSRECAELVALIDESLIVLSKKRSTLEEKAIAGYFHNLIACFSGIIGLLHSKMPAGAIPKIDPQMLIRLRTVNENVRSSVNELQKVLMYNLNYLEQYFEYDYCAELLDKKELLKELQSLQETLRHDSEK